MIAVREPPGRLPTSAVSTERRGSLGSRGDAITSQVFILFKSTKLKPKVVILYTFAQPLTPTGAVAEISERQTTEQEEEHGLRLKHGVLALALVPTSPGTVTVDKLRYF